MTNTRLKDFFDLALPMRDATVDDAELQQAVEATDLRGVVGAIRARAAQFGFPSR